MTMKLPDTWCECLGASWPSAEWLAVQRFLQTAESSGATIYPPVEQRFAALASVAPTAVKVVILGQDPYHGAGQAHGLSFSVPTGVKPPPSLVNIFKEIHRDLGIEPPAHGNLQSWAAQGVLLLNSVLTVEAERAGSHRKQGWEALTDAVIETLATQRDGLVFMLWGAYAQAKAGLIPSQRHLVLQSAHPSPLSAYRGFLGNGHFGAANRYLQQQGQTPIDWRIG